MKTLRNPQLLPLDILTCWFPFPPSKSQSIFCSIHFAWLLDVFYSILKFCYCLLPLECCDVTQISSCSLCKIRQYCCNWNNFLCVYYNAKYCSKSPLCLNLISMLIGVYFLLVVLWDVAILIFQFGNFLIWSFLDVKYHLGSMNALVLLKKKKVTCW